MNLEVISHVEKNGIFPKLSDGTIVRDRGDFYFEEVRDFIPTSTANATKAKNGPFNGEFTRFISRLETKLSDKRLNFILSSEDKNGQPIRTAEFQSILKQFLGYIDNSNISIIDLSSIPFDVLSITVSLISRLIFDF